MKGFTGSILALFSLLVTVAIIAALVSNKSQTSNVITSFFNGFANVLKAAVAPIS